jgi:sulfonate transport system ATP-binding protein
VDEALHLADRALVLEHGKIVLDIPIDLPRPRRHEAAGFGKHRAALLGALGVEEG